MTTTEHPGITGDKPRRHDRIEFFRRDDITGSDNTVYMRRWILVACRWFSIRVHKFLRSDNDVLHDHPWPFVSLILKGGYWEERFLHDVDPDEATCHCGDRMKDHSLFDGHLPTVNPETVSKWYRPGSLVFRKATDRHRVVLEDELIGKCDNYWGAPVPCWSICLTGPVQRKWGFWCPTGWVHWKEFLGALKGVCS